MNINHPSNKINKNYGNIYKLNWINQPINAKVTLKVIDEVLYIYLDKSVDILPHYIVDLSSNLSSPIRKVDDYTYKSDVPEGTTRIEVDYAVIGSDNLSVYDGTEVMFLYYTPNRPYGDWFVVSHSYSENTINYVGTKTNGKLTYRGTADFDLITTLVRSFHDSDMQQWQGFRDAVNELTGVTDWVLDPANNQIKYTDPSKPVDPRDPTVQYYYHITNSDSERFEGASPQDACKPYIESMGMVYDGVVIDSGNPSSCLGHRLPSTEVYSFGNLSKELNPNYNPNDIRTLEHVWYYGTSVDNQPTGNDACIELYRIANKNFHSSELKIGNENITTCFRATALNPTGRVADGEVYRKSNPNYDPTIQSSIAFSSVSQKIISNTLSSNEGVSLLAEAYIDEVANSINNTEESKQFVKLSDLVSQFEQSKQLM